MSRYFSGIGWMCLFGVCLTGRLWSQATEIFEQISSGKDFQQSIVYSLAQDSFGNIWAGTEEGIIRYNSHETFLYNKYQGIIGIHRNRTSKVFIDSRHTLWMGNEEGLSKYFPAEDVFIPIRNPDNQFGPNLIKCIIEDNTQNIWIGAFNGIWKYNPEAADPGKVFTQFAKEYNVFSLHSEGERILAGTDKGLIWLDPEYNQVTPYNYPEAERWVVTAILKTDQYLFIGTKEQGLFKLPANGTLGEHILLPLSGQRAFPINKILQDAKGHLYLATDGAGLLYLSPEGRVLKSFTNDPNDPYSIASNGLYDVILDAENLLWIATYGGGINILSLAGNYFQNIQHRLNDRNSLAHSFTRSILEDQEGNIWFGTKEGISIWKRSTGQWTHLPRLGQNATEPDIVMALAESQDYIWAGTYGRGAFRINKKDFSTTQYNEDSPPERKIALPRIYSILVDRNNNCWLGGIDQKLHRIAADGHISTFPITQIRKIIQTKDGSILVAGRTGVQSIKDDRIRDIETLKVGKNGPHYTTISCILEDRQGRMVLGTNGSGLVIFDPATEQVLTLTPQNGMPSDIVQGVLQDDKGVYWVSTTRGLASVSLMAGDTLIKVYNKSDGLIASEFNYGSFARLSDGTFAFGSIDGVSLFKPSKIEVQGQLPKLVLENFQVLNEKHNRKPSILPANVNVSDHVVLRYYENAIKIKFAGILHSMPSKVLYSWKMDGLSDEWSEPNEEDQINFTNLSPGRYTFRVKAANRDGVWGKERMLGISISPPWWATNEAYAIYVILSFVALIGLSYLANMLIRKRNADEQIAFFSNITHELKTPLSILLSTLQQASQDQTSGDDTHEKIKTTVKRLNTLFEQLLNFNKISSNQIQPKDVSRIGLQSYVQQVVNSFKPLLEERDIDIRVENRFEGDVFFYDKEVLNKILFNLLSNAVKYSRPNGKIELELAEGKKNALKIAVTDNGIGIPRDQQKFILKRYYRGRNAINSQMPGTGLGLMIVKSLVERDRGSIEFESIENEGTTFTVLLHNQEKHYQPDASHQILDYRPEEVRDTARMAEFSDAKILIVEDNDELRQIMVEILGTHFQVFEAVNGKQGLDMVGQIFPDLIITDLIMPEMDGIELCRVLQEDINTNHIPVFLMTVLTNSEYKLESIESGVAAFLEKPVDMNFLLAKIVSTLDWQKKLREKYHHHADIENAEKYRNKRDADFLNSLEKFVLEKVLEENLSVYDLCKHVGMSRTALYMKLKNMVDLSPQNFIIHTRLKYARKLFLENNLNVKEVAYMAGFSNPKYFSTSFRKVFGESPTTFLKSLYPES